MMSLLNICTYNSQISAEVFPYFSELCSSWLKQKLGFKLYILIWKLCWSLSFFVCLFWLIFWLFLLFYTIALKSIWSDVILATDFPFMFMSMLWGFYQFFHIDLRIDPCLYSFVRKFGGRRETFSLFECWMVVFNLWKVEEKFHQCKLLHRNYYTVSALEAAGVIC